MFQKTQIFTVFHNLKIVLELLKMWWFLNTIIFHWTFLFKIRPETDWFSKAVGQYRERKITFYLFISHDLSGEKQNKLICVCLTTDCIPHPYPSSGHRAGLKIVKRAQELFSDTLDIEEMVIVVDARKEDRDGMTKLTKVLKKRREEMIVSYDLNYVLNLQP